MWVIERENERLRNAPPREVITEVEVERIVEVHIPPDPVDPVYIRGIGDIVRFVLDARGNPELLEILWDELKPYMPPIIKSG